MSPFCSAFAKSNDNLVVHVRYVSVSVGTVVCLFVRIFRPVVWPSWVKSIKLSGYLLHGIALC